MDFEFNVHNEPRVVVPYEALHSLVLKGYVAYAELNRNLLSNGFSNHNITA